MTYRKELDGLRAVAIGGIVFYYAQISFFNFQIFQGGFVGVDIFFVISGYLITTKILRELLETESFSFLRFYERRAYRVFPVLFVLMLVSLPFAWVYLVNNEFILYSKSVITSLSFTSNFFYHFSGNAFGEIPTLKKPFIHTWSISLLVQLYILFPIILFFLFKYFKKILIYMLGLLFLISFGTAIYMSANNLSATFYFTHTRGWEFFAGAILAYLESKSKIRSNNQSFNLFFSIIGLILIGYSILFFNDKLIYPSFLTLFPVIGSSLIICFSGGEDKVTKLLSSKLFVWIGLISFSLYLWHYPIFTFLRISQITPGGDVLYRILTLILVITISFLSYLFLEKPFKDKKINFKKFFILSFIFIMILFSINLSVVKNNGYPSRVPEILSNQDFLTLPWTKLKNLKGEICHENLDKSFGACKFNTKSKKKIYIQGDSHVAALSFELKDKLVQKGYQVLFQTECLYFPGFDLIENKSNSNKVSPKCNNKNWSSLRDYLKDEKNSIIVLGGRFPLYLNQKFYSDNEGNNETLIWNSEFVQVGKYRTIQDSFKSEVLKLSKNNKIILIYPIPEMGLDPKSKIFSEFVKRKKFTNEKFKVSNLSVSYEFYKIRTKSSFELLDSIDNNNIYRIYPHKLFCDTIIKDRCIAHDGKYLFYFDDDHPSEKGANLINKLIVDKITKINK
jgi:peptidoglycan/LPS O-acetylase OafA/YrhL